MKERQGEARTQERLELVPLVDVYDTDEEVVLMADMPGVKPQDLEINVDNGSLAIRGRRTDVPAEGSFVLAEFRVGDYVRHFTVGEDVDTLRISAELVNGVLKLTLPKGPERKVRKIAVKGA